MAIISTHGRQTGSATIYQFPVGGRVGQSVLKKRNADDPKQAVAEFAITDAWYHQEAIRESNQSTKQ